MKRNIYTKGHADIGWEFLAFVATSLGQLAPELLRYLLLCADQAAQTRKASVASGLGDDSIPVDENDSEPEVVRNPTFPKLRALNFQQIKNSESVLIRVQVMEAVVG